MATNRLNENYFENQQKSYDRIFDLELAGIDLRFAAQVLLNRINFFHDELKNHREVIKLELMCKQMTKILNTREGV